MLAKEHQKIINFFKNLTYSERVTTKQKLKTNNVIYYQLFSFLYKEEAASINKFSTKVRQLEKKYKSNFKTKKFIDELFKIIQTKKAQLDIENKLLDTIQKIRLLFSKNLNKEAFKLSNKAKQTCETYELYHHLLMLVKIEIENIKVSPKDIRKTNQLFIDLETIANKCGIIDEAKRLQNETQNIIYNAGLTAREITKTDFEAQIKILNDFDANENASLLAKYYTYTSLSNIEIVQQNYTAAFYPIEKLLKAFEEKPIFKTYKQSLYIQTLINYCNRLISANICDDVDELAFINNLINELLLNKQVGEYEKEYLSLTINHAIYAIYLKNNQIQKAYNTALQIEKHFIFLQNNKALYAIFSYELAQINFYVGNYNITIDYINNLMTDESRHLFPDLYLFSRLLNLFVLTEQNEKLLFIAQHEATRKAIAAAPHKAVLEKILATMLLHYNKAVNANEQLEILNSTKQKLSDHKNKNESAFMFFQIDNWIENKMKILSA